MIWDEFLNDDETVATAAPEDRPMVTDGTHVATIAWAGFQTKEWAKGDTNKDGKCLVVKLDLGPKWRPVWETIPCTQTGKVQHLCRSARVDPPARGVFWDGSALKGKIVTATTVLSVAKSTGRDYVKVESFKPGQDVPPTPVARARPKSAADKAMDQFKKSSPDDDIPF
jgi:hypothetical protein